MSFSGTGTGIQNANDVYFSGVTQNDVLQYNSTTSKWNNTPIGTTAALVNNGGLESMWANYSATGAVTLDLANGNAFRLTLTGNVTLTYTGATNNKVCSFTLYVKQDGTGSRTITWPDTVAWAGATAPTISTAAGATDIFVFETITGGTLWYGSLVGTGFAVPS